jgi:hypothetical protein
MEQILTRMYPISPYDRAISSLTPLLRHKLSNVINSLSGICSEGFGSKELNSQHAKHSQQTRPNLCGYDKIKIIEELRVVFN